MATDPTLLYVVGAAKAGTSWLYRYLRDHPDCHFRSIKELHFFDSVAEGTVDPRRDRLLAKLQGLEQKFVSARADKLIDLGTEIADINAWLDVLRHDGDRTAAYLDYLKRGVDGETLIGDVTPSYALLSAATLDQMAGIAPDVRFIFIMRDPVERLWSHVRMEARRQGTTEEVDYGIVRRLFFDVLNGKEPEIAARGDYASAVEKLKATVDPNRVLLALTEEMLSDSGIRKICTFLGISFVAPQIERRVHEGPDLKMRPRQRQAARDWLKPQYEYVEQLFGRLPKAWQPELVKV